MNKLRHIIPALMLTCILGTHEGFIALWKPGGPEPIWVSSCRVECLPPADQAALHRGIPARTPRDLARLLEDFLS